MLTDASIKALKAKEKPYKVTDRDSMYVLVSPTGSMSFRYDYRINGRRETVVLGRYGRAGLSLARAREKCVDAKRLIAQGISPAIEKQREKRRIAESKSFGQFGEKWLSGATMANSTRAMRRSIFERELLPVWLSITRPLNSALRSTLTSGCCGWLSITRPLNFDEQNARPWPVAVASQSPDR